MATGVAIPIDVPKVLGGGVPGGVVSMPLSSIIFSDGALHNVRLVQEQRLGPSHSLTPLPAHRPV